MNLLPKNADQINLNQMMIFKKIKTKMSFKKAKQYNKYKLKPQANICKLNKNKKLFK